MDRENVNKVEFCTRCGAALNQGKCDICEEPTVEEVICEEIGRVEVTEQVTEEIKEAELSENEEQNPTALGEKMETSADSGTSIHSDSKNEYTHYDYSGQGYYQPQVPIEEPKKKMNTGVIIAIVVGASLFFTLLIWCIWLSLFYISKDGRSDNFTTNSQEESGRKDRSDDYEEEMDEEDSDNFDFYEFEKELRDKYEQETSTEEDDYTPHVYSESDEYYFGLQDSIDESLSYSVEFEEESIFEKEQSIYFTYPVLKGDIPNIDYLNEQIYSEIELFHEVYEEEKGGTEFLCEVLGYVTYMSEDVISIVFDEYLSSDNYYTLSLVSFNIDIKQGTIINNTEILEVNDTFSVEFRKRETIQNSGDSFESYTDQELTSMLKDSRYLIVFYTPLGMEVGLNYDYGWATVTYKDYETFLKSF